MIMLEMNSIRTVSSNAPVSMTVRNTRSSAVSTLLSTAQSTLLSITGKKLDSQAKVVGTEELAVTSELANEIGDEDTSSIVNDLKAILDQTKEMSDQELHDTIVDIANDYNQTLSEEDIGKLISLVRSLEKLDTNALMERVKSVRDALSHMSDLQDTAKTFTDRLRNLVSTIVDFFKGLGQ